MPDYIVKVGKKGAIYLPKKLMREMDIQEGDKIKIITKGNKIIMEVIPDPLSLALKTKKWAKITVEEFEEESVKMQDELYDY